MPNILTLFLIFSILFTGSFWFFIHIQSIANYFLNKKKEIKFL